MRIAIIALAVLASPAFAQGQPEKMCVRRIVVPGFEAWGGRAANALAVGRVAALTLRPAEGVRLAPPPTRKAVPGSFAGAYPVVITRPGRYRIALSGRAWVEVTQGRNRVLSATHGHGPDCSGIAKIVAFDLKPGRYWVQLTEAKAPAISAMIAAPAGGRPAG